MKKKEGKHMAKGFFNEEIHGRVTEEIHGKVTEEIHG